MLEVASAIILTHVKSIAIFCPGHRHRILRYRLIPKIAVTAKRSFIVEIAASLMEELMT